MRVWMVPPQILCRKHLLGEHVETHMFKGAMRKHIALDGYLENNLLEIPQLANRHALLVEEMQRRGYRHASPLPAGEVEALGNSYPASQRQVKVDAEASRADLLSRCPECLSRSLS